MNPTHLLQPSVRKQFNLKFRNFSIPVGNTTKIMGIVNVTADSFSKDGCLSSNYGVDKALNRAKKLIQEGADIIDVGGESTRPGAQKISVQEETKRIIPVIHRLVKIAKIPISVDTYKPDVAKHALDAGVDVINDIMGVNLDKKLLKMVKNYNAGIVLMHIRGTPQTMQKSIRYINLIKEIISSLRKSIENCLEIGIKSDKIIIDPGIGFGKTVEHNLEIICRLKELNILGQPILIGPSRKSFIGKILNKKEDQRLMGTITTVCVGIIHGAHIVRVHDVKAIKEVACMSDAILNKQF